MSMSNNSSLLKRTSDGGMASAETSADQEAETVVRFTARQGDTLTAHSSLSFASRHESIPLHTGGLMLATNSWSFLVALEEFVAWNLAAIQFAPNTYCT